MSHKILTGLQRERQELVEQIKLHSLQLAPPGEPFTLKSGEKSTFYLDLRKLHLWPPSLKLVVDAMIRGIENLWPSHDAIGGPSVGADPIVGGIMYALANTDYTSYPTGFLVRPEAKGHGVGGRIVGTMVGEGDRCVIIEDVITSGISSLNAIQAVEETGAKVIGVLCVVDRMAGGVAKLVNAGYPTYALLDITDLGIDPPGAD